MTMVIPIFPLLGASSFMTGILFSSKAAFQICSTPIMTYFVDRHGRAMIVGGLILEAVSCGVFYGTCAYASWMSARALSGVASAAIISAGFAQIKRRYEDKDECATAMGLATTGIVSGVVCGPVVGGLLYQVSPQLPFAAMAILDVFVAIVAALCLPQTSENKLLVEPGSGVGVEPSDSARVADILRHPQVWRPLGALMVTNAGISCLESTFPRYALHTFGWSAGQVGASYLLTSVPSVIMSGCAGPLGNRVGNRPLVLKVGVAIQGLFTMLGPKELLSVEAISLLGLGFGMGIVDGVGTPILGEASADHFGGTGKIFVLSNAAVQLGFVAGPVLGNAIVERCGFSWCCIIMGAAMFFYAPVIDSRKVASSNRDPLLA